MNKRTVVKQQKVAMPAFALIPSGHLQRKCACGGSPGVDGECAECRAKRLSIQRRATTPSATSPTVPPIVHDVLSSSGQPLDATTQAFMAPRFGHDFSNVRVHTDARAAESALAVNALAYTVGRDVAFGVGQYAPETREGRKLLAHELTHVVQQGTTNTIAPQARLEVSRPYDTSERGADTVASQITMGMTLASTGNQGVGLQLQRQPATLTPPLIAIPLPPWSKHQLGVIQKQLQRLGLYRLHIDRIFGPGTESGLTEAFGGDEWRTLDPEVIIARLNVAERPKGKHGQHNLRYGEMFKDGVLDITLGIGFDEGGSHLATIENFQKVLTARAFKEDPATAIEVYKKAGRVIGPSAFGKFFVRLNALIYKPPAGKERPIHAVVRLLFTSDGTQGAEAAAAFKEGMKQSDIAYYSGHGRYGSGPDFDRDMSFELLDENGMIVQQIQDESVLEKILRDEGSKVGRGAWEQFKWRAKNHRINVIGFNKGNIYLNPNRVHSEFGANLMYWNLKRTGDKGATPVTGNTGELAELNPERKYQLWVFDGCRTQDYVRSIRKTPGHDMRATDILATQRLLGWGDETNTLAVFLDSVLGQQSAETIIKGMDEQQSPESKGGHAGGAYKGFGIEDNPIIR